MKLLIALLLIASCLVPARVPAEAPGPFVGADLSSLPRVESGGGVFRVDGAAGDVLVELARADVGWIRLRLWHTPPDGACGLPATLDLAERARDAGLNLLLDLHYSDTWADPGRQAPPAAWTGLPYDALTDSVHVYTRDVLAAFAARGCVPAAVQIGNEITAGLLWDAGRVGGAYDTPGQWDRLAGLLQAATAGLAAAAPGAERPRIVLHLDRGGDNAGARRVLDRLVERDVAFDVLGLSYYPWWHGDLDALEANLRDLAAHTGRDVWIVETAYPWTLRWFDDTHNGVGRADQLLPGFPATPAGQAAYLERLLEIVGSVPGTTGVFWWEPAWIATPGFGSPWENLAWFDERGRALPVLTGRMPEDPAASRR